jgi:predicted ATPase
MKLPLQSFRLKNFKAVQDSGAVPFTPLTVLIGNNGSGKSSLIEGLETFHAFVSQDLDSALQVWRGIEHVRNKVARDQVRHAKHTGEQRSSKPISFQLTGCVSEKLYKATSIINERGKGNVLFVEHEEARVGKIVARRVDERMDIKGEGEQFAFGPLESGESLLSHVRYLNDSVRSWQFLNMAAQHMGAPVPQTRTRGAIRLAKDGRNIAEYLLDIFQKDRNAFDSIVETMRWVLPYSRGLQADITSELERSVYLQMSEGEFKVPGWLLSTGTLRILALLAVLRHPTPPPLLIVEELENGLDPRTIHLILDEIRSAVQEGRTQVIATTHSPYLLDRLPLQTVVLVERENGGQPVFWRPNDSRDVRKWAKSFAPGQLYTTGQLKHGPRPSRPQRAGRPRSRGERP